jgi:hypothetical protein
VEKLRALQAADDRSLQIGIARSLRSARGEVMHAGGLLSVGRRDGAVPYALRVLPLRHVVGLLPDAVPYVSVFIADPVRPALSSREDLMAIFGFTAREAELALLLGKGRHWPRPPAAYAFRATRRARISPAPCTRPAARRRLLSSASSAACPAVMNVASAIA